MECIISIILTNKHAGLNESLAIGKYMQIKHKVSLMTYDLSHYSGTPLHESDVNKIKDLIETMSNHYNDIKINVVADELHIKSIKEFFSGENYDITSYVMNNVIKLSE